MKSPFVRLFCVFVALALGVSPARAQLFENLRVLGGDRYTVGDPSVTVTNLDEDVVEGPKDIAVADLDGDGKPDFAASNKDGSVTVYFGVGDGTFAGVQHLRTWVDVPADLRTLYFTNYYTNSYCDYQPTNFTLTCYTVVTPPPPSPNPLPPTTNIVCFTNYQYGCVGMITNVYTNVWDIEGPTGLRGLALADFTGDGRRDIAVASPGESLIYLFVNQGGRDFGSPTNLASWFGVRDLAAGDFDGDGLTDLAAAGTTNGIVQLRSLGGGLFQAVTNVPALRSDPLDPEGDGDYDFPQPAYYLKALRQPGDDRDELIASFAQSRKLWVLRANTQGRLEVSGELPGVLATALDAAPLLRPATSDAVPDLITAYSPAGCLDIRAGVPLLEQRFAAAPVQQYFVPGGPRNVRIADLDGDGWNDVVVVAQRQDRVLTYHNDEGQLTLLAQAFVGRAPREMDLEDFNGDGRPDLAVLNRGSMDVSVLITSTNTLAPVGFLALDSVYPVDGGVSGLELRDFNGDGRPDVMQLHRDSSEFSVRLTEPDARLGAPTYYAITNGFNPAAQIAVDINGDGRADMISANLSGSVTVRLGLADGTFGPEETFVLPPGAEGSLFALVAGDFNGDGHADLAAGYFDCRVSFFKGDGTGKFIFIRTDLFTYEPRSMAVGDFDQDGDLDLVGGSLAGKFVIVENRGNWFTGAPLRKLEFPGPGDFGSNLQVVDQNNDGDPDLLLGYPGGFTLYIGGPDITFSNYPIDNGSNSPRLGGSTFVFADLDGDGDNDLASICASNSCLSIEVQTNGQYITALTVPVPITRYLATDDLDGDGFADLVGSGDVLWVALSSRKATNAPPSELLDGRGAGTGVVINEVLSSNMGLPLAEDSGRTSDWIEIYNSASQATPLAGWRLMLVRTNTTVTTVSNFFAGSNLLALVTNSIVLTNTYTFPSDTPLSPGSHRVLVCSDRIRTPYHTGFNLPAEGGLLRLLNAQGVEASRVVYPALDPDLSYARYTDGARRFVVNNIPSPGAPNADNGAIEPELTLNGVDLDTLAPGRPLRFRATARDDIGIINVSVLWRRLDIPDNATKRLILYDDGMNEDGPMNDGRFMGVMTEPLPPGAVIQFYLECTDLTDQVETSPNNPRFVAAGTRPQMHSLAIGVPPPPLEISEIVADNATGLTDERGGRPDWIEIRNCSSNTVSLAGVTLGLRMFGDGERMTFTNRPSIGPGEHIVIYADGNPNQGQLHAPFQLDRLGGQVFLTGTTATGARFVIDAVSYGPQSTDTALARLGCGGPWVTGAPTPRQGNVAAPWRAVVGPDNVLFAFPTRAGRNYTIQHTDNLGGTWNTLPPVRSVGVEQAVQGPPGAQRFFRVRED